jgi:uncharacterized protein YodC (DUF2158 family)
MSENHMGFQLGDIVRLKSGGPKMTVRKLMGVGVDCVWFEGNSLAGGSWFESYLLINVEDLRASG